MSLDKATVRGIARLARLRVDEDRLEPLARELNNILGWIEQLSEVDTEDVEPMTSIAAMKLRWRDDRVTDGGQAETVTASAPTRDRGFFAVPKVVE